MSNALGIAAVTAVLRDLLNNGLIDASIGDVAVSAQAPDKVKLATEKSQLNLFLYQVTPNQGWRNVGLPSADSAGTSRMSNPPLALDLHYLLTAYGANDFEPEILLGYGMQVLHENPVLSRQSIRDSLAPGPVTGGILPPALQTLTAAELADQIEQIKVTPEAISGEEISRLWAAFGANYRTTTAYRASVVLIESRRTTRPALPVRLRQLFVIPLRDPHVERVSADDGKPVVSTSTLVVEGQRLLYEPMEVLAGGLPATISDRSDTRVVVALPAGLRAGVQSIQVKHGLDFGTPDDPHRGLESNVAAFVIHPVFGGLMLAPAPSGTAPYEGSATVTVTPLPARDQRIVLLLNRTSPAVPSSYSFTAAPRANDAAPVVVPLKNLARGEYFARVQVDGAESPLDLDPASPSFGPKATI